MSQPVVSMTPRERFRRCMHYQSVDRIPHLEFGYRDECFPKWHTQGLPKHLHDNDSVERYFGCEHFHYVPNRMGLFPQFEYKILEERPRTRIVRYEDGVIAEVNTDRESTIPHYIDFPIKDRRTWQEFKERLNPRDPSRFAYDLNRVKADARASQEAVAVYIGSLFGVLRNWTGFEQICYLIYDDRDLVEEMVEHMCDLAISVIEPLLKEVEIDVACGWEDICFNQGPMISPQDFRAILFPRYRRIADLLHRHGITVIFTDCDGNICPVVPIWMEAGYNCMFPVEVHAGTDPVALRKEYGKDLLIIGGYDKRKLESKSETLAEWKRLEPVVAEGGFIPHVDHRVPSNVDYENYRYYMKCKKDIFGIETIDVPGLESAGEIGERGRLTPGS
ncbi:MAG TPA: uroporphyrinogen decarboxylase family protein [bacterium]|nr:uroporphyrinogen decarboxylase family protein [bacterium]